MSYKRHLGSDAISRLQPAMQGALRVLEDPYLPEVTTLVLELRELSEVQDGPELPGVGLKAAVMPLKGLIAYRKHRGAVVAGAAAALGLIFVAGYATGRRRHRRRTA